MEMQSKAAGQPPAKLQVAQRLEGTWSGSSAVFLSASSVAAEWLFFWQGLSHCAQGSGLHANIEERLKPPEEMLWVSPGVGGTTVSLVTQFLESVAPSLPLL